MEKCALIISYSALKENIGSFGAHRKCNGTMALEMQWENMGPTMPEKETDNVLHKNGYSWDRYHSRNYALINWNSFLSSRSSHGRGGAGAASQNCASDEDLDPDLREGIHNIMWVHGRLSLHVSFQACVCLYSIHYVYIIRCVWTVKSHPKMLTQPR